MAETIMLFTPDRREFRLNPTTAADFLTGYKYYISVKCHLGISFTYT